MQQKSDGFMKCMPQTPPAAPGFPATSGAKHGRLDGPRRRPPYSQPRPSRRFGQRALHRPQPSHRVESITIWPEASREMAS